MTGRLGMTGGEVARGDRSVEISKSKRRSAAIGAGAGAVAGHTALAGTTAYYAHRIIDEPIRPGSMLNSMQAVARGTLTPRFVRKNPIMLLPAAAGAGLGAGVGVAVGSRRRKPVRKAATTTMSDAEAHRVASQYDTRGPLPKGLSRDQKMKAYEGRYIAAGGRKGETWHRRAQRAEVGRNVGLVGATTSAAALLAARGKHTGPALRRIKVTPHRAESAALGSALGGGWSELYGEHARSRRASYQSSPAGVAGSALSRMQAYTPTGRKS